MKIATWNVNSIKARLGVVQDWLTEAEPDVALFQEIKSLDKNFPTEAMEELGYNVATHGQKSYNGVAILSKFPLEDVVRGLPTRKTSDDQARYIEAVVPTDAGAVRVASIYAPNGNPVDSDKFPYKLDWLEDLREHARNLAAFEEPLVLGGDMNVILTGDDAYDPEAWRDDALFQPESRRELRTLLNDGLTDAFRACHSETHQYTFWDYQGGAWQKDHGIRIDYLLLSPQAADCLNASGIDRHTRGWQKPSDHVPVWCELDI